MLLHPLDFLGSDDDSDLGFFPGMGMELGQKQEIVLELLELLTAKYCLLPLRDFASLTDAEGLIAPKFNHRA